MPNGFKKCINYTQNYMYVCFYASIIGQNTVHEKKKHIYTYFIQIITAQAVAYNSVSEETVTLENVYFCTSY